MQVYVVRRATAFHVPGNKAVGDALLEWRSDDPFAITVLFDGPVEWRFSVDLMLNALTQSGAIFGEGDVTCCCTNTWFKMLLRPPNVPAVAVAMFAREVEIFAGLFRPQLIPAQAAAQDAIALEADGLLR